MRKLWGSNVLLGQGKIVSQASKQIRVSNAKSARSPHDSGRFILW
jgi:hypothetical protein